MDDPKPKRELTPAEQAIRLELAGATYAEIGRVLGMSSGDAFALCAATRTEGPKQKLEDERALDVARCNALLKAVWANASSKGDSESIRNAVLLMQRRAKLMGLDAPVRQEVTGKDGAPLVTSEEILLRLSRLAGPRVGPDDDKEPGA